MNQLEGLFKTIIEHYKEVSLQTGKASSSIIVESNYAAAFFRLYAKAHIPWQM